MTVVQRGDEGVFEARVRCVFSLRTKHTGFAKSALSFAKQGAGASAVDVRASRIVLESCKMRLTLAESVLLLALIIGLGSRLDAGMKSSASYGWHHGQEQPYEYVVMRLKVQHAAVAGLATLAVSCGCSRALSSPARARWATLPAAPIAIALYSVGSLNCAGGYYNNFYEMFANLDVHNEDIQRRSTATGRHRDGLARERAIGIHRFCNGCEFGAVYTIVSAVSALAGSVGIDGLLPLQCALVALGNAAISFAWAGLPYQWPEALWQLRVEAGGRPVLRPVLAHPDPSY